MDKAEGVRRKRAVVFCHGELQLIPPLGTDDLIICADGGGEYARKYGIVPHMLVGDMDSISRDALEYWQNQGIEVELFPVHKDKTDSELAVELALEHGVEEVLLLGALGGRWDHSLANVNLLEKVVRAGCRGAITDGTTTMWLLSGSLRHFEIDGAPGDMVSLIPLSDEVSGVTIAGFEYPLNEATLKFGSTWGISNVLTGRQGQVEIKSGRLLIVHIHK